MDTVAEAISDLDYAFKQLKIQVSQFSDEQALTQIIDPQHQFTLHDIISHLAGWVDYILEVLPAMLASIDSSLPPLDPARRTRQALTARANVPTQAIWNELDTKHRQIVAVLQSAQSEELTMRRTRQSQTYTIKGYLIDPLRTDILEYVDLIKTWQEENDP